MIEIADFEEVTRIRMSREVDGKPVYWVAAYLVDGLLVDTGCAHTADELVAALEGRRLDLVVNTHFHEDHVAADRAIMERFGVPVLAHRDSVPRIGLAPELNPYQEYVWGYPQPASVSTLGAQVDTAAYHFEVIETPGHSAGHVALFEREKGWCFTGDIFITERPKVIRADEDAVRLMGSMRMLAALPSDRLVLFTSMGKVVEDGREALLACADYLQELKDRVRGLQEQGLTPIEIRERVFGEGSSLAVMTGGHFSSDNLVASLLA